jgi:serine O-acetyltransferase
MAQEPNLASFWHELEASHRQNSRIWALRPKSHAWLQTLLAALFPHFWTEELGSCQSITPMALRLEEGLLSLLCLAGVESDERDAMARSFLSQLPSIYADLLLDAQAIERQDPAANSVQEVMLAYPGFLAIAVHRIAHPLSVLGAPLIPRVLSEWAHRETGIDIHPAALIASPFAIDHGTGVVIGETTVIGKGVKIYQGVTLGALSVRKEQADAKRHPTIEDDVVIYAGTTILGGKTTVGRGSIIAGGAFLTTSVPPFSLVTRSNEVRPVTPAGLAEFLDPGINI